MPNDRRARSRPGRHVGVRAYPWPIGTTSRDVGQTGAPWAQPLERFCRVGTRPGLTLK